MERTKSVFNSKHRVELLTIEAFKSTGYLIVNKTLIQSLGLIPAVLLSNYIDKYIYFKERYPDNDGWFFLPHDQQMEQLNIGEYSVVKYKNILKERGILETQRQGVPAKEWLRIDFSVLSECFTVSTTESLVTSVSGGLVTSVSGGHIKGKLNKENKNKIHFESLGTRNNKYLPLAQKLSTIVCTTKNMKHTPTQIRQWCNNIRQLVEGNGITYERIDRALQWYTTHVGDAYVPVIESGSALKDKFTKLENAMTRVSYGKPPIPEFIIEGGEKWWRRPNGKYYNSAGVSFVE